ncbi:Exocyst complex component 5 [Phlyctochytrium planicorne]|nr:Exocyst complex component 5 [Phlyctochytrium planicorne]
MDQFKGSFSAKVFIEQSAKKATSPAKRTTTSTTADVSFDPKPLIRSFETSLDELLRLRRKVQNKIDDLDDAAKASEVARKRKLGELHAAIESAVIARRLAALAKELDVPGFENARVNIEKFCEEVEQEILSRFDTAYKGNDKVKMNINKKKQKSKSKQQPVPMQAVGNLLTMVGLDGTKTSPQSNKMEEDPSKLSIKTTVELIKMHLESAKRCKELSKQSVHAKNSGALFKKFVDIAGIKYIQVAVELAAEEVLTTDAKSEPEIDRALNVVCVTSEALQLIQLHFQTCVIPTVSSSPSAHREAIIIKNEFMSSIEDILNQLLQKQIEMILAWLASILSKQKKVDFRPKDEAFETNLASTQQCCEFLKRVAESAVKSLDAENLEVFLCDIGFSFHGMILEHIKKYTFSYSGGVTLTKDLARYYETMSYFNQRAVTDRFEMLREIGNLFIVKPENLQTVVSDGYLSRIELGLLLPFLMTRSDWGRIQKFEMFSANNGRLNHNLN